MFGCGISKLKIRYGPIIIDIIFWIFFYIMNFICNIFANSCEEGIKFICNFDRLRLRDIVDINLLLKKSKYMKNVKGVFLFLLRS
jgi:hypothetical protein